MEIKSQIQRYIDRRVCLDLMGRSTIWGKVVSVEHDHVVLVDTVVHRDAETLSRFDEFEYAVDEDGRGESLRFLESVISFNSIAHITYVDNREFKHEFLDPPQESALEVASQDASTGDTPDDTSDETEEELPSPGQANAYNSTYPGGYRIELQLGMKLIALADSEQGGTLLDQLSRIRKRIEQRTGYVIPKVRVTDNISLPSEAYAIFLNGNRMASEQVEVNSRLALNIEDSQSGIQGRPAIDPVFGLKSLWIDEDQADRAEEVATSVVDVTSVILTHIEHVIQRHLHELINICDVLEHIERLSLQSAFDVLFDDKFPIVLIHRLLRQMLEERIAIGNFIQIIESLAFHIEQRVEPPRLFERLRVDIGRNICSPLLDEAGQLTAVYLEPETTRTLASTNAADMICNDKIDALETLKVSLEELEGPKIVLVRDTHLRRSVFEALSRLVEDVHVIAVDEIPKDLNVQVVGKY